MAYSTEELGRLIARAHYQAWRLDAPPFDLTPEELAAILPNLITSGSAGIVWHRVRPFRERYGAMAYALEAATEAQIAHNQRVEAAVVECVTRLRAYGIEPVLVKGLALAKLYPEGIVRPAGDIDLVVRKEEFAAAHAILHDATKPPIPIDIDLKHPGNWEEVPNRCFWARTSIDETLGGVRTLDKADSFEMAYIHFMKHSGIRPLWHCDVFMLAHARDRASDRSAWPMLEGLDGGIGYLSIWNESECTAPWLMQFLLDRWGGQVISNHSTQAPLEKIAGVLRWPNALEARYYRHADLSLPPCALDFVLAYPPKFAIYGPRRLRKRCHSLVRKLK